MNPIHHEFRGGTDCCTQCPTCTSHSLWQMTLQESDIMMGDANEAPRSVISLLPFNSKSILHGTACDIGTFFHFHLSESPGGTWEGFPPGSGVLFLACSQCMQWPVAPGHHPGAHLPVCGSPTGSVLWGGRFSSCGWLPCRLLTSSG